MEEKNPIDTTEQIFAAQKKAMDSALTAMRHVADQPDNPKIKRLDGQPSAFVMNVSSLTADTLSLSPFTYDFLAQYEALIELLAKAPTHKTSVARLNKIVNGSHNDPEFGRFHPDAIANVAGPVNELLQLMD